MNFVININGGWLHSYFSLLLQIATTAFAWIRISSKAIFEKARSSSGSSSTRKHPKRTKRHSSWTPPAKKLSTDTSSR